MSADAKEVSAYAIGAVALPSGHFPVFVAPDFVVLEGGRLQFTPCQARALAGLLLAGAAEAERLDQARDGARVLVASPLLKNGGRP